MNTIIAVDFDGCLCKAKWPDIGEARTDVIRELLRRQREGAKLILWSCRDGEQLQAAVLWCLKHGIRFDAVNDNLPEQKEFFGNNSRKVYANEYWDDKAVLVFSKDMESSIIHPSKDGEYLTVKRWIDNDLVYVSASLTGYQYSPPKKGLRDKWREILRIMKE